MIKLLNCLFFFQSTMRNCMHLIERIFLQQNNTISSIQSELSYDEQQSAEQHQTNSLRPSSSSNSQNNTSTQQHNIYAPQIRNHRNYRSDQTNSILQPNSDQSVDQSTPTEVFSVSALYVTWPKEAGHRKCQKSPKSRPAKKLIL